MTNIIRLNESINDYAARPVITALGEPDLAIRPSTYLAALGTSTNIDPTQILIDGRFGQTTNPAPFIGVGTGAMTVKSDANGAYLAMPQKGIRTGTVMSTRNDRGTFMAVKYRLNDIFSGSDRLFSVGQGTLATANFNVATLLDPKRMENLSGYSAPMDNLVHTLAIYSVPGTVYLFVGNKKYSAAFGSVTTPNDLTGVGINTRSFSDTPPNDLDLYNFELYLDVSLTEQQIIDYLKTL
nr:hypothetical protein [Moraxella sp. CTOTU48268]